MSDFNRRDVIKSTAGAGIGAVTLMTGSATADNGSSDHREIQVACYTDETEPDDSGFISGVMDGINDWCDWMETWCAYVSETTVLDFRDFGNVDAVPASYDGYDGFEDMDPVREGIASTFSSDYIGPGKINIVITSRSDRPAGRYDHRSDLYSDEGSVMFVNTSHTGFDFLTGDSYGYNFAIHEMIHGMTTNDLDAGDDHGMGAPRMGRPTVMATGYTATVQEDDRIPSAACDGSSWSRALYPLPQPEITRCTAHSVLEYHYGGEGGTVQFDRVKDFVSIDTNERPYE